MEYQLYEILLLFAICSVLGWVGLVCVTALTENRYENRSVCRGPCSIGCGAGAVLLLQAGEIGGDSFFGVFGIGVAAGLFIELLSAAVINGICKEKLIVMRWYHLILSGLCAVVFVFHLNPILIGLIRWAPPWANLLLLLLYWIPFLSRLVDGLSALLDYRKKKKAVTFPKEDE